MLKIPQSRAVPYLLFVLALLLLAGSIFICKNWHKNTIGLPPMPPPAVQIPPPPPPQINSGASSWKTYRNTEFGFEIKYPASWRVNSEVYSTGETFIEFKRIANDFEVGISISNNTLNEKIQLEKGDTFIREEQIIKNNIPMIKVVRLQPVLKEEYYSFVFLHEGMSYAVRGSQNNAVDEMLDSLHFIR